MTILRWVLAALAVAAYLTSSLLAPLGGASGSASWLGIIPLLVVMLLASFLAPGDKLRSASIFYCLLSGAGSLSAGFSVFFPTRANPEAALVQCIFLSCAGMAGFRFSRRQGMSSPETVEREDLVDKRKVRTTRILLLTGIGFSLLGLVLSLFAGSRLNDLMATPEGLCALASSREKQGMEPGAAALDLYSKAIDLNPNYVPAYLGRARAFMHMGNRASALKDVECGLKLEPENTALKKLSEYLQN